MEQSMSDQLRMSYQPSLLNLTDVTGSQALEFGITPLIEPDGGTVTGRSGQDRALASLSPRRAKEMGLLTSGTYGLRGSTLSSSADLASSLASRFRAKTRSLGSTLFTLIWKVRYTPSGRPIFAVRASGLRTSGRDCTSWPTPTKQEAGRNLDENFKNVSNTSDTKFGVSLHQAAQLTTWRSPSASDGEGGVKDPMSEKYAMADAPKFKLRDQSTLAQLTDSGEMPSGSIAATESTGPSGQLNPGHSRWLMSLPPIWDICGIRAADAIRSRRSSKKAKAE